jgi:single-stranded DNA-binding protein
VFIDVDQDDQYGNNGMITQNVSKEEKEQGVKGNILGNCKVFWQDDSAPSQPQQQGGYNPPAQASSNEPPVDFDDDIPF